MKLPRSIFEGGVSKNRRRRLWFTLLAATTLLTATALAYGAYLTVQPYAIGGVAIKLANPDGLGYYCTLGYKVARLNGSGNIIEYGAITAGHCTRFATDGWAAYLQASGEKIGDVVLASRLGDVAYIPSSKVEAKVLYIKENNYIIWTSYEPVNLTVIGYKAFDSITKGEYVCKTGQTTGTTCGEVIETRRDAREYARFPDGSIDYFIGDLVYTNVETGGGDSGGPLYKPLVDTGTAILYGHLSAGNETVSIFVHPETFADVCLVDPQTLETYCLVVVANEWS